MSQIIRLITKKEILKLIKDSEERLRKEFYNELNKLRNQIIDINDIMKVIERRGNKEWEK